MLQYRLFVGSQLNLSRETKDYYIPQHHQHSTGSLGTDILEFFQKSFEPSGDDYESIKKCVYDTKNVIFFISCRWVKEHKTTKKCVYVDKIVAAAICNYGATFNGSSKVMSERKKVHMNAGAPCLLLWFATLKAAIKAEGGAPNQPKSNKLDETNIEIRV